MKTIILDRDGVINHDRDDFVKSPDEWIPIAGSLEAIARLHQAGYRVIVATNQSGIGRGLFDASTLDAIHAKMQQAVQAKGGKISAIYFCPHTPDDHCECRKPRPGLLEQAQRDYGFTADEVCVVGDSLRDIEAGQAMGYESFLVKTGKGERMLLKHANALQSVVVSNNLLGVVDFLLTRD